MTRWCGLCPSCRLPLSLSLCVCSAGRLSHTGFSRWAKCVKGELLNTAHPENNAPIFSSSASSFLPSPLDSAPSVVTACSSSPIAVLRLPTQLQYTMTRKDAKRLKPSEEEMLVDVDVRIMGTENGVSRYFVAKDVCQLINLRKGSVAKAIKHFTALEKGRMPVMCKRKNGSGCVQVLTVLTESGLRRLMTSCKLSTAAGVLDTILERVAVLPASGSRGALALPETADRSSPTLRAEQTFKVRRTPRDLRTDMAMVSPLARLSRQPENGGDADPVRAHKMADDGMGSTVSVFSSSRLQPAAFFPPFVAPAELAASYLQSRSLDLIDSAFPRVHDGVQTQGQSSSLLDPIFDRQLHHFHPVASSLMSTQPIIPLGSLFRPAFTLPSSLSSDVAPYYSSVGSATMLPLSRPNVLSTPWQVSLEQSVSETILQRIAGLSSLAHPSIANKGNLQRYHLF